MGDVPVDPRRSVAANIAEILRSYKETGEIGKSKPKSMAEARRQAAKIAYEVKREARKAKKKKQLRLSEIVKKGGGK